MKKREERRKEEKNVERKEKWQKGDWGAKEGERWKREKDKTPLAPPLRGVEIQGAGETWSYHVVAGNQQGRQVRSERSSR